MKQNIGKADRIARIVIGVALLSLLFVLDGDARWLGLLGLIPLGTAAVGFCPLYCPLKMDTRCCSKRGAGDEKKSSCCGGGACSTDTKDAA
jgi:hypothetical protein